MKNGTTTLWFSLRGFLKISSNIGSWFCVEGVTFGDGEGEFSPKLGVELNKLELKEKKYK